MRRPKLRVAAATIVCTVGPAAILALLLATSFDAAQDGCPDVARGVGPPTIEEFATADGVCTVPGLGPNGEVVDVPDSTELRGSDGYVKHSSSVWLDAHAKSSGFCDVYLPDGSGGCILDNTQVRNVAAIRIAHGLPSGLSSTYHFFPVHPDGTLDNTAQDVDTRLPQTTSIDFKKELFSGVGKHLLRYWATIGKTSCTIEPGATPTREVIVTVTSCKPNWLLAPEGSGSKTLHVPKQPILIYVPASMSDLNGPVDLAAGDWNSWLAPVGLTFTRVTVPCGSGGDCINVTEAPVGANACASYVYGNTDTAGVQTSPGTIKFPVGWNGVSANRLRRSVGHEIGHSLGLHHNSCSTSNSIMSIAPDCTSTTGMTISPTATDIWPVKDGAYGLAGRKTCNL